MIRLSPMRMILIGFVLLVIGFILPFAMVLRVLESTLLLNFFAYLSSIIGLVLGLLGLILHASSQRRDGD